jgi:hypothetical protein
VVRRYGRPIDVVLAVILAPAAALFRAYRTAGSQQFPLTTRMLKKVGVFPIRRHYYEPLFDDKQLRRSLREVRDLPGIDFRMDEQLELIERFNYRDELIALDLARPKIPGDQFSIANGTFESGDAEFLYQFLRLTKPRTVIEIGSGSSTRIARIALEKNASETGLQERHECIEPYEMPWLEQLPGVRVRRERVETTAIDWASELGPGDLLFVDSSHIIVLKVMSYRSIWRSSRGCKKVYSFTFTTSSLPGIT